MLMKPPRSILGNPQHPKPPMPRSGFSVRSVVSLVFRRSGRRRARPNPLSHRAGGRRMTLRTLGCGQVTPAHYGTSQTFAGWVHALRVKGNLAFLVLRDRTGQVQSVIKKDATPALFDQLAPLTPESVVSVTGLVQATEKAKAGFEVVPTALTVLNVAATPLPFALWDDKIDTGIDTRLDHRFLDLRGSRSAAIFRIRHKVI